MNDNIQLKHNLIKNISRSGMLLNSLSSRSAVYTKSDFYYFNKLVGICTKKGNKKMAYSQVYYTFNIIKQFFKISALHFLRLAVYKLEPFVHLQYIKKGKKDVIFPRILSFKRRVHNALFIIVKEAFRNSKQYRNLSISLVYSILDYSMFDNSYSKKIKNDIEIASSNKRNFKYKKRNAKNKYSKIRRRIRFKLFTKIKHIK